MSDDLLIRARAGDSDAFSELIAAHERRIYSIALRICGNPDDAMDAVQEALIRLFKSLRDFKGQSSFATWAYRVVTNACLDELRRRKSRNTVSLEAMIDIGAPLPTTNEGPESEALRSERLSHIAHAMNKLPHDLKVAIVLRDVQGFSYDEIASMLDTNLGTVKSRISRGRDKLREYLSQAELFPKGKV